MKVIHILGTVIAAALVMFIGVMWAAQGNKFSYENVKDIPELISQSGCVTYVNPNPEKPFKDVQLKHILSSKKPWDPFQPSEIACHLANATYVDFRKNGLEDSPREKNCWPLSTYDWVDTIGQYGPKTECLLNYFRFRLEPGATSPSGFDWDADLKNSADLGPCNLCQEGTDPIPYLDEVCLNMQFRDRLCEASGIDKFCNAACQPTDFPVQGFKSFGNDECDSPSINNQGTWQTSHCTNNGNNNYPTDFCDNNGDNLIYNWGNYWVMDCRSTDCGGHDDSVYEVSEKDKFNGNKILSHDGQTLYSAGVVWIVDERKYTDIFARIPNQQKDTNFDKTELDDTLHKYLSDSSFYRWNRLGWWFPENRRIIDMVVNGIDVNLNYIQTKVAQETGLKTTLDDVCARATDDIKKGFAWSEGCVFLSSCTGKSDCIETKPIKLGSDGESLFNGGINNLLKKSIVIKSNVQDFNKNLNVDPSKKYRIVINNWAGAFKGYLGSGTPAYFDYVRTIGIMQLEDKQCCDGSIKLSFRENDISSGTTAYPIASGLEYCDYDLSSKHPTVYFYKDSANGCLDHSPGDGKEIGSCNIDNEETTYCLTDENWFVPSQEKGSCMFTNGFTSGSSDKKYWACIDKDGKNGFNDAGESASETLRVKDPPIYEFKCGSWQTCSKDNPKWCYFDSTANSCGSNWAVSCASENYYPNKSNDEGAYGEDVIQSIRIDPTGKYCQVNSLDIVTYNEQGRRVCSLCSNVRPSIEWGVSSHTSYNGPLAINATGWLKTQPGVSQWTGNISVVGKSCSSGYPISCMADVDEEHDYGYVNELIDLYLDPSDDRCHATFRNIYGEDGFSVNIGIVCSGINYGKSNYSSYQKKDGNAVEIFTDSCYSGYSAVSGFTKSSTTNEGAYMEDAIQTFNITGGIFRVTAKDTIEGWFGSGKEQLRQTGVLCRQLKSCPDGTLDGSCSSTKPLYCQVETLISKCSQCGCPSGYSCLAGGTCGCSDGTLDGSCSNANKGWYCQGGTLVKACGAPHNCGCPLGQTCQADQSCRGPCTNHDECSQACTSLCPSMVYGCCFGCEIGQCVSGTCQCVDGRSYCSGIPNYQKGPVCTSCFARGTACTSNSQCCSNECNGYGICYDSSLSNALGAACYDGSECSSNSCMGPMAPGHPGYCVS